MKLEIYKTATPQEYSWRLMSKGREVARMPDGTANPSKIKRTVKAFRDHSGVGSGIWRACEAALLAFEELHPSRAAKL